MSKAYEGRGQVTRDERGRESEGSEPESWESAIATGVSVALKAGKGSALVSGGLGLPGLESRTQGLTRT